MSVVGKLKSFFLKLRFRKFAKWFCSCEKEGDVRQELYSYKFVKRHLIWSESKWLELTVPTEMPIGVKKNKTIFVYWKQGFDKAPDLVKKCLNSVKKNAGSFNVVCLDEKNVMDYVCIPKHIQKKHDQGLIQEAHFSDIVRACLLYRYGGVWCDATCFLSQPIDDYIADEPFFVFQNSLLGVLSPIKCSNWFIKADQGSLLLGKIMNFLFSYYEHFDSVVHYYLFHIVLSALVNENPKCRSAWLQMPYVCNMNPHVFQFSFGNKYSPKMYESILRSCFIHKLSYKYKQELLLAKEMNVLQYFLNETSV